MGPYRSFIALASIATSLLLPTTLLAARQECVSCHGSHFGDRGGCTSCHGGNDHTRHLRVAHHGLMAGKYAWSAVKGAPQVTRGKKLIKDLGCLRCHSIKKEGNPLAAPLDRVPAETPPAGIAKAIDCPALYMPTFYLDEKQVTDLVNAILAEGRSAPKAGPERPVVVHFQREGMDNIFERRCGACHRALTSRFGGGGRGDIGPNLSGLFSDDYPGRLEKKRWSKNQLRKWLENPRRYRRLSTMPPIPLASAEYGELMKILTVSSSARR